jgi:hypothetical protein
VAATRAPWQTSHAGPPPAGLDTTVRQMPSPSSARHALRALRPRGQRSVVSDQLPSSDQRNCCFCVEPLARTVAFLNLDGIAWRRRSCTLMS